MATLPCPYLGSGVVLSDQRERHISERHPDLLPRRKRLIEATLADPDEVRRSARSTDARLFSRWYDQLGGGKHVVVVVATPQGGVPWVMTGYIARKLAGGKVEWKRN